MFVAISLFTGHFRNLFYFTLIILIHELGHSLTGIFLNLNLKRIEIYPYGGCSKLEYDINTPYRDKELNKNKFGDMIEFVKCSDIEKAMNNLCIMIKVLLENKDNIPADKYIKEVIRIEYRYLRIHPYSNANGRTARAIVNILLQSKNMLAIFRKENREEYLEWVRDAHRVLKDNEERYIKGLVENPMDCVDLENEFLERNLPFLLVKN